MPPMKMTLRDALTRVQESDKLSLRQIAERAKIPYDTVKNISQGKSKRTNYDDALKLAKAFGVSLEDFLQGTLSAAPTISVPSHVGAGDQVDMVNPYAEGDGMYHVACPPQLSPHGMVALEIRGQSMEPVYLDGGLIFYSREALAVPTEAEFRICVAEDEEENIWLKQVKPSNEGRGLYDLISFNPKIPPMYGKALKWASQVRFYLPPDIVDRLERG